MFRLVTGILKEEIQLQTIQKTPFVEDFFKKSSGNHAFRTHAFTPIMMLRTASQVVLLMEKIWRSPVESGSLSHDLQGFVHSRWCINSIIQVGG